MGVAQQDVLDLQEGGSDKILTGNINITLGSTYPTLSFALNYCKTLVPRGFKATIYLWNGFVLNEQIFLENCDLSFVEIVSQAYEYQVNFSTTALVTSIIADDGSESIYPAFSFINAKSPSMKIRLRCDTSSPANSVGIFAKGAKTTVKLDYGTDPAHAGGVFDFARNIYAIDLARVYAYKVEVVNSSTYGVQASRGAYINVDGAVFGGSMAIGLCADRGGWVSAIGANLTGCTNACSANAGGDVDMTSSTGGKPISCTNGSLVHAYGTTGSINLTAINKIYQGGIIFR
jgi:hypothetical protein